MSPPIVFPARCCGRRRRSAHEIADEHEDSPSAQRRGVVGGQARVAGGPGEGLESWCYAFTMPSATPSCASHLNASQTPLRVRAQRPRAEARSRARRSVRSDMREHAQCPVTRQFYSAELDLRVYTCSVSPRQARALAHLVYGGAKQIWDWNVIGAQSFHESIAELAQHPSLSRVARLRRRALRRFHRMLDRRHQTRRYVLT